MWKKRSLEELARPSLVEFKRTPKLPLRLLLDDIRSAHNVGSLLRTADGLALEHVYLCGITARPPHRDILKTALGADRSVDWSYHDDALNLVRLLVGGEQCQLICLEQTHNSIPLREFAVDASLPLTLVVGHEVHGVDQRLIDASHGCIEIEQFGTKHSLNVAVAAGMALWELACQLRRPRDQSGSFCNSR